MPCQYYCFYGLDTIITTKRLFLISVPHFPVTLLLFFRDKNFIISRDTDGATYNCFFDRIIDIIFVNKL